MEKGIQRGETEEIAGWPNTDSLRRDTNSKAVKLPPGLQSPVLLKMGGRRADSGLAFFRYAFSIADIGI